MLGGGPGEALVEPALTEPEVRQVFARGDRDVILLDQRGDGVSDPVLTCAAVEELDEPLISADDRVAEVVTARRDELIDDGVDLDGFDHVNNARDVDLVGS